MNVADALLQHFVDSVWGNPAADSHAVFQTNCLTPPAGSVGTLNLPIGTYTLPTSTGPYSVYAITHHDIARFNLDTDIVSGWVPLSEILVKGRNKGVIVQAFTEGQFLVRNKTYLTVGCDGIVLLAVDRTIPANVSMLVANEPVYVRFYANAIGTRLPDPTAGPSRFHTYVRDANNLVAYNEFLSRLNQTESQYSKDVWLFINGVLVVDNHYPAWNELQEGDVLESVEHSRMDKHHSMEVDVNDTYQSTVDTLNKLIFSPANVPTNTYVNDIEFWLTAVDPTTNIRHGLYLPRLHVADIRQLTFKDWSINAKIVSDTLAVLRRLRGANLQDIRVTGYFRTAKLYPSVLQDINRTKDLENLSHELRGSALAGTNATFTPWAATTLESSGLNRLMETYWRDLSEARINAVYSRQGALEAIERPWWDPNTSSYRAPRNERVIPGTVYRYVNGGLQTQDTELRPKDTLSGWNGSELFIPKLGSTVMDSYRAAGHSWEITLNPNVGYEYYYDAGNGTAVRAEEGTDFTRRLTSSGLEVTWLPTRNNRVRYIRHGDFHVEYTRRVAVSDLRIGWDIYPTNALDPLKIGMGELYLWWGDRMLVPGLDYYVRDFKVYILRLFPQSDTQVDIRVLYTGLPDPDLTHKDDVIWGWVKHGLISYGDGYTLLKYRNRFNVVNGLPISPMHDYSSEDYQDFMRPTGVPVTDGHVWCSRRFPSYVDERALTQATESLLDAKARDKSVADYIDTLWTEPARTDRITIASRYDLVSPFMERLIWAIHNDQIIVDNPNPSGLYIQQRVNAYRSYLRHDPTQTNMDDTMVEIYPMRRREPISMSAIEYNFLVQVNAQLLGNKVSGLNLYVVVA